MRQIKEFHHPSTVDEATAILRREDIRAVPLAGATALAVDLRPTVEALVDLSGLGLDYIRVKGNIVHLGAMATAAMIKDWAQADEVGLRGLTDAAGALATRAVSNRVTLGGSVAYLPASADLPVALLAVGATLKLGGPGPGETRKVPMDDLAGTHPTRLLRRGEIILEAQVPVRRRGYGGGFLKFGRTATDYALGSVGVGLSVEGGLVREARVVVGGMLPQPARMAAVEAILVGRAPGDALFAQAGQAAAAEVEPRGDARASQSYRKDLCGVLVRRALGVALSRVSA
jgi:aerobic carbon-monoxide dehydrogenase medium subunit